MDIIYPSGCESPQRKTEYLYRAQELLRELHNLFSEWLHEGISKDQYALLPKKIKDKYPYKDKLLKADWDRFQEGDFKVRSDKICQEICMQRAELKKSTAFSIDIGDI